MKKHSGDNAALRPHRFRVVAIGQPAPHLTRLHLEPLEGGSFTFRAGQFAKVGFAGLRGRNLSIASRAGSTALEFLVRDRPHHGGNLFARLKPGDVAEIEGPFGEGYWREDHAGPILAAAGGSGVAPVKSIVETALMGGTTQPIHFYLGVRDEPDLYLEAHFEELARKHGNLRFVPVLSEAANPRARRTGLVGEAIAADLPQLAGFKAYVFGPPAMVKSTVETLAALGIDPADIHTDDHEVT